MPPPHLDFWPFDLEVGVGVVCDLGYPCAKFRLPRPFGFRVKADVRDTRQTDADDCLMPLPPLRGRGHNKCIGDDTESPRWTKNCIRTRRYTAGQTPNCIGEKKKPNCVMKKQATGWLTNRDVQKTEIRFGFDSVFKKPIHPKIWHGKQIPNRIRVFFWKPNRSKKIYAVHS